MAPHLSSTHEFELRESSIEIQKNKLKAKYPILLILASLPFRYFDILAFMIKLTKSLSNH